MVFCALQQTGMGGMSWWQTISGLLIVFGLLVLSLKLLGKFNSKRGRGKAEILAVWQLGPKREVQVLKLFDTVHYIYRHDGALVNLRQQSLAEYNMSCQDSPTKISGDFQNIIQAPAI